MPRFNRIAKKAGGPFSTSRCALDPPPALLDGIDEFNRGLFFEQHETLEDLWHQEPDDVRYLYQGILLVGVGVYHLQRENYVGATSKLARGGELLRWFVPGCQGVDVGRLVEDAARLLAAVESLGPDRLREIDPALLPRVYLLPPSGASRGSRESAAPETSEGRPA